MKQNKGKDEEMVFLINKLNSEIKTYYKLSKSILNNVKNENVQDNAMQTAFNNLENYLNNFINNVKQIFKNLKFIRKKNIILEELNSPLYKSNFFGLNNNNNYCSKHFKTQSDVLLKNNDLFLTTNSKTNYYDSINYENLNNSSNSTRNYSYSYQKINKIISLLEKIKNIKIENNSLIYLDNIENEILSIVNNKDRNLRTVSSDNREVRNYFNEILSPRGQNQSRKIIKSPNDYLKLRNNDFFNNELFKKMNIQLKSKNNIIYKQNNQINYLKYHLDLIKKNSENNEKVEIELINKKLNEQEEYYKNMINENFEIYNKKCKELQNNNFLLSKENKSAKNKIEKLLYINRRQNSKFSNLKIIKVDNFLITQKNLSKIIELDEKIQELDKNNIELTNDITSKNDKISKLIEENNKMSESIKNKDSQINLLLSENEKINKIIDSKNDEIAKLTKTKKISETEVQNIKQKEKEYITEISKLQSYIPQNYSSATHKIISEKKLAESNLQWFLITIKSESEVKNYSNTFWVTEKDIGSSLVNYINITEEVENEDKKINKEAIDIEKERDDWLNKLEEKEDIISNLKISVQQLEKQIQSNISNNSNYFKNTIKTNTNTNINTNVNTINNLDTNANNSRMIPIDKYIKMLNKFNEANAKLKKVNELMTNMKNNYNEKNFSSSEIRSNECNISSIINDSSNEVKKVDKNYNNLLNDKDSDETSGFLEKYIEDLENRLAQIKSLIQLLIHDMKYDSKLHNTILNILMIVGFSEQEAEFIIQDKHKKTGIFGILNKKK